MFVFARKEFVTYKKTAVKSNLKEIILVNVFASQGYFDDHEYKSVNCSHIFRH